MFAAIIAIATLLIGTAVYSANQQVPATTLSIQPPSAGSDPAAP